jgi:hypothetical protein
MEKQLTPTEIQKLRICIELLIEKALEQGYYLRQTSQRFSLDCGGSVDESGGCCALGGVLAGSGIPPKTCWFRDKAADILGVDPQVCYYIEGGFEGWHHRSPHTPEQESAFALGVYLRKKYV